MEEKERLVIFQNLYIYDITQYDSIVLCELSLDEKYW